MVVSNIKDTNYWKQFTTWIHLYPSDGMLFRISKIPIIESNSQLYKVIGDWNVVVSNIKDTNYWKQFTTVHLDARISCLLFRISKIPIIESNSQQMTYVPTMSQGCFEYQRYQLLKAIHNLIGKPYLFNKLFRISKIPIIESNSQPNFLKYQFWRCCFEYQRYQLLKAIHNTEYVIDRVRKVVSNIKDTNYWKQFTTNHLLLVFFSKLFRISKIPIIESNSQLLSYPPPKYLVVSNIKDTNYWKQFTTRKGSAKRRRWLFRISKIPIIESNSQLLKVWFPF